VGGVVWVRDGASDGLVQAAAVIVAHCHPVSADRQRGGRERGSVEVGLGGGGRIEKKGRLLLDSRLTECEKELIFVHTPHTRHFHGKRCHGYSGA